MPTQLRLPGFPYPDCPMQQWSCVFVASCTRVGRCNAYGSTGIAPWMYGKASGAGGTTEGGNVGDPPTPLKVTPKATDRGRIDTVDPQTLTEVLPWCQAEPA